MSQVFYLYYWGCPWSELHILHANNWKTLLAQSLKGIQHPAVSTTATASAESRALAGLLELPPGRVDKSSFCPRSPALFSASLPVILPWVRSYCASGSRFSVTFHLTQSYIPVTDKTSRTTFSSSPNSSSLYPTYCSCLALFPWSDSHIPAPGPLHLLFLLPRTLSS